MLSFIKYQFWYYRWQWLGTIPVFVVAALIIGVSLNGVQSIQSNAPVFQMVDDPTPIFGFPIFFGGVTLFLICSTLVRLVSDILKEDQRQWLLLGASHAQLSYLIAGQLGLIASLSSLVGYLLSLPLANGYYRFLQSVFGIERLPYIRIEGSLPALVTTLFLVAGLAALSGFFYSFRQLKARATSKRVGRRLWDGFLSAIVVASWLALIGFVWTANSLLDKAIFLFSLLLVQVILCYRLTPIVQIGLLKTVGRVMNGHYASLMARWELLDKVIYLKSLNASMLTGVTLIIGFRILSQNIFSLFQEDADLEMKVSMIVYLGAPILLILANVLAITVLSSYQDGRARDQLKWLGVSIKQLLMIKLWEALSHTVLILGVAFFFNATIWGLSYFALVSTGHPTDHILPMTGGMFPLGAFLLVLIFVTKSFNELITVRGRKTNVLSSFVNLD